MADTAVVGASPTGGPDARPTVVVDRATHRRRGLLLLAAGAFQVWLWVTRIVNLVGDPTPRTTGFVVVHAVLYSAALAVAAVLLVVGWRMRRDARLPGGPTPSVDHAP